MTISNADVAAAKAAAAKPLPLVAHDLIDFKAADFPIREPLMVLDADYATPVFTARSLNQIFAWRGTGKTMSATSLAGAMAVGGKFLNLQATRKMKVMYVEGESPNAQLQERAKKLIHEETERGFFRLVTLDSQPYGIPPFSTIEGRNALEAALGEPGDTEVLFLDSISTLAWIPTNDEEAWLEILPWLARLRSRGLCIVFLHHAGKGGLQRGHSRSEDMLDVSIKLSRPDDEECDYLRFKMEYDKFRGDRTGIRALSVSCKQGLWAWRIAEEDKRQVLRDYLTQNPNASAAKVARDLPELGDRSTVWRMMQKPDPQGEMFDEGVQKAGQK